jgi:membrane protease YdiL (CAAX protease family)
VTGLACERCGRPFKPGAAFCAECGGARFAPPRSTLRLVIGVYLAILAVQTIAIVYVKYFGGDVLTAVLADSAAVTAIAIVIGIWHRELVASAYRTLGWSWRGYALVLLAAPFVLAAVIAYVRGLTAVFGPQMARELSEFDGQSIWLAIAVVAIAPPLYEELTFRGLMFGSLRESFSGGEAVVISSFAFALMHLSILSLVTHLPLGLYLGWLRQRSGSMWPSTFAHFCHNLGVVYLDARGWA